jgi:hypothetical protein
LLSPPLVRTCCRRDITASSSVLQAVIDDIIVAAGRYVKFGSVLGIGGDSPSLPVEVCNSTGRKTVVSVDGSSRDEYSGVGAGGAIGGGAGIGGVEGGAGGGGGVGDAMGMDGGAMSSAVQSGDAPRPAADVPDASTPTDAMEAAMIQCRVRLNDVKWIVAEFVRVYDYYALLSAGSFSNL